MDGPSPFDDMSTADTMDKMPADVDRGRLDKERIPKTPRKKSNVEKAKAFKHLAAIAKREKNQVKHDDSPHQYNMGGHGSAMLHR